MLREQLINRINNPGKQITPMLMYAKPAFNYPVDATTSTSRVYQLIDKDIPLGFHLLLKAIYVQYENSQDITININRLSDNRDYQNEYCRPEILCGHCKGSQILNSFPLMEPFYFRDRIILEIVPDTAITTIFQLNVIFHVFLIPETILQVSR